MTPTRARSAIAVQAAFSPDLDEDEEEEEEEVDAAAGSDFFVSVFASPLLLSEDPLLADVSAVSLAFDGVAADEPFLLSVR